MSKAISLKIQDHLFQEMAGLLKRLGWKKNAYINRAIAHFNRLHQRRLLAQALQRESRLVQGESMAILHEFEATEDELP